MSARTAPSPSSERFGTAPTGSPGRRIGRALLGTGPIFVILPAQLVWITI